jgi:hypothetical protein
LSTVIIGSWRWLPGTIDADGHRTWKVNILTQGNPYLDGPAAHAQTPGLPLPGATYLAGNDLDIWAWCHGERDVAPYQVTDGGVTHFLHTFTFSTRAANKSSGERDDKGARKKCSDTQVQDPLQEPPAISRASLKESREEWYARGGHLITYTSFEQIRGPGATFDRHRDQVTIEQNLLDPQDKDMPKFLDFVNDQPIWDLPARCWKLCDRRWQRKSYGTCGFYYVRTLVFESNAEDVTVAAAVTPQIFPYNSNAVTYNGRMYLNHWDHYVLDESSKFISGFWDTSGNFVADYFGATPNPNNPTHYINAFDKNWQPIRAVLSNDPARRGYPAKDPTGTITGTADANYLRIAKFEEANFLLLGIPTTLSP